MIRSDLTAALPPRAAGVLALALGVTTTPPPRGGVDAELARLAKEATARANEAAALARGEAPPGKRGDYKQAMGAVVPATDEPPEATIRRMRDDGEGSDGP